MPIHWATWMNDHLDLVCKQTTAPTILAEPFTTQWVKRHLAAAPATASWAASQHTHNPAYNAERYLPAPQTATVSPSGHTQTHQPVQQHPPATPPNGTHRSHPQHPASWNRKLSLQKLSAKWIKMNRNGSNYLMKSLFLTPCHQTCETFESLTVHTGLCLAVMISLTFAQQYPVACILCCKNQLPSLVITVFDDCLLFTLRQLQKKNL